MNPIRLTFWSLKGGVGKTTLALNFAFHFKCGIITNERYSMLDKVMDNGDFLQLAQGQSMPQIPLEHNVIFDMGGYLDNRVTEAVKQSSYVIIPTSSDKLDLQGTISTIGEIEKINPNIVVIINKSENHKEFLEAKQLIQEFRQNIAVFEIKKSKALRNILDDKKSIIQSQEEGGLKGYVLKSLAEQFKELTQYIEQPTRHTIGATS